MDILVLNDKFETTYLIDAYKSLIWNDRYSEAGDFELYTEVSGEVLNHVTKDMYLSIKESDHTMIVSDIEILSDIELGNHIRITGSSLEKILDRRIVWTQTQLTGSLQNGIKKLINENIISASDHTRRIPNFIFQDSSDEKITKLTINKQYTGDNIYDAIVELCQENSIGFKVILNTSNQFVFSLYAGKDRSYDQSDNPFVIFSPKYENLVNSNYYETNSDLKTITLIGGQGEGSERIYTTLGSGSGLARRELFTDARDLSPDDITEAQYIANLTSRGQANLDEHIAYSTFDGEVEVVNSYIYREDYNVGDIVQIENEYGKKGTTRITEVITSHDNNNGYSIYPTFEMIGGND